LIGVAEALTDGDMVPSISGSYVNRHQPNEHSELAAYALKDAVARMVAVNTTVPLPVVTADDQQTVPVHLRCVPALTGLGCFLQHRRAFLSHYHAAPKFIYTTRQQVMPAMCQAHLLHASELSQWLDVDTNADRSFWVADDFDYCLRELEQGRLVYVAPVAFGHDSLIRLMPDSHTVFPGLRCPAEVSE